MLVSELSVYPVKSFRGVTVATATLDALGLRGDRRWMVLDAAGNTVTARRVPRMLTITAAPVPGGVQLSAAGHEPLLVPEPQPAPSVSVTLSRTGTATAAHPEADEWVSRVLGASVRLVWLDDAGRRTVDVSHGGRAGDVLSLADAGPVLLTSAASLRQLDAWVAAASPGAQKLAMERFRPNVVIDGDLEPFVEDAWAGVRLGDVELRLGEHCDRCVLTTVDPDTLATGKEPLRTLARHRRRDGKVWFGIRMIPVTTGTFAVGDAVVPVA